MIGDDPSKPTWHEIVREGIRAANEVHEEINNPRLAQARKQRSSLIKLASSAFALHRATTARGLRWRDGEGPLVLACTALATAVRNAQQENSHAFHY
jgi:hypothetical protein